MIKGTTTTWKFFIAEGEGDRGFWGITGEGGQSFLTGFKGKLKKIGTANEGRGKGGGGEGVRDHQNTNLTWGSDNFSWEKNKILRPPHLRP